MPKHKLKICSTSDLQTTGCKSFSLPVSADQTVEGFVVVFENNYFGYLNSCPHLGVELNWAPDTFLSHDSTHIICSVHGARFQLTDGLCIQGPCYLQSLQRVPIEQIKSSLYLNLKDSLPPLNDA